MRSQIGNTTIQADSIYLGAKSALTLRKNQMYLYALLDMNRELENLYPGSDEYNNEIDVIYTCIRLVDQTCNVHDDLARVGNILSNHLDEIGGVNITTYERNRKIEKVIITCITELYSGIKYETNNPTFSTWWADNILGENNLYPNGSSTIADNPAIGSVTDDQIAEKFKESGPLYIYTVDSDDIVNTSRKAITKKHAALNYRKSLSVMDVNLAMNTQEALIISGCAKQGYIPRDMVDILKNKTQSKIGDVATITAVVALVVKIITGALAVAAGVVSIVQAIKSSSNKTKDQEKAYNIVTDERILNQIQPSVDDFNGIDVDGDGKSDIPYWLIGVIGVGLVYYLL